MIFNYNKNQIEINLEFLHIVERESLLIENSFINFFDITKSYKYKIIKSHS